MISSPKIKESLFASDLPFEEKARAVAAFQLQAVAPYRLFSACTGNLRSGSGQGHELTALPFLPIDMFRSETILAEGCEAEIEFTSSGTTGGDTSVHRVADASVYRQSIESGFRTFYGDPADYSIYALLPSYLEQENSSLVYMVRHLMALSGSDEGGFFKYEYEALLRDLSTASSGRKRLLIGVSFALWEMAERFPGTDLGDCIVMETGGMKGRRREIVREELHGILCDAFRKEAIHSEYGMTELLSQAWSDGSGLFRCPPWMRALVRDPYDPFAVSPSGRGVLNVIDLANLYSCSFIGTNDLGEVYDDGSFRVLGRTDHSTVRGCNLMFT